MIFVAAWSSAAERVDSDCSHSITLRVRSMSHRCINVPAGDHRFGPVISPAILLGLGCRLEYCGGSSGGNKDWAPRTSVPAPNSFPAIALASFAESPSVGSIRQPVEALPGVASRFRLHRRFAAQEHAGLAKKQFPECDSRHGHERRGPAAGARNRRARPR